MAHATNPSHVKATCLCGAISYALPAGQGLPMESAMCHCSDCRYATGALYLTSFQLLAAVPQELLEGCTKYDSSETRRKWFCRSCASHVFVQETGSGDGGEGSRWWVMGGVLEQTEPESTVLNTTRVSHHIFVNDTGDGGLASKLIKLGGRVVECWEKRSYTSKQVSEAELQEFSSHAEQATISDNEPLECRCHCGGVDLKIIRPDFKAHPLNEKYTPKEKNKYLAGLCVCRSCRLATGVSFQPWAYVPQANILLSETGANVEFGEDAARPAANGESTLQHIWSSKKTCRSFCGTCGATIFYWHNERPDVVDISVDILRSDDGVMARKWVPWRKDGLSCKEECIDEEILQAIFPA